MDKKLPIKPQKDEKRSLPVSVKNTPGSQDQTKSYGNAVDLLSQQSNKVDSKTSQKSELTQQQQTKDSQLAQHVCDITQTKSDSVEEAAKEVPAQCIKIGTNVAIKDSPKHFEPNIEMEYVHRSNNPFICSNKSRQWQPPFFKSQSLELYTESSIFSNIIHQHLNFQLPEITESQLLLNMPQEKKSVFPEVLNAQEPEVQADSSAKLDEKSTNLVVNSSGSIQRSNMSARFQSLESRPIYPNVPFSPYASPYNSPRTVRRRTPLRESRRVSIEQSGSFLQLNQYKLLDQIGQGSYGLVKLAYSEEDSTHYAMKILSKRKLLRQAGLMRRGPKKRTTPLDRVYREIAVLKKLDHPNVVKLVEVLDDPVEDSLYMVFELVKQGEVLNVPTDNPLSEERAWNIFRGALLGLEYLHYQKIIHGDLKPGNLLLTESGHVKIADLGVCNEFLGDDATMSNGSTAGTPAFRAPETLTHGQLQYCGKAADIWALGATLYALVFGNVPFIAQSIPILYENIKNADVTYPETPKISPELRNCIDQMLKKDPAQRITLPKLKEDPWVTSHEEFSLPSEEDNCCLIQISDDDINSVVRSIPKLDTLILIKTMLKNHSFGNPFSRGSDSGRSTERAGIRLERFARSGRSNSAPGSYDAIGERPQLLAEQVLPSLDEQSSNTTSEE